MGKSFAVLGRAFYSNDFDNINYIDKGLFCVDDRGYIENVIKSTDLEYENAVNAYKKENTLYELGDNEVILPGFVDLHIHAPQWAQSGTALDRPLEVWLTEYTFPLEAKYRDLDFADKVYNDVVRTTLYSGTTTAVYFATVDREPSVRLAEICGELGQRAFVGKVVMDEKEANPGYCCDESADSAVSETEKFIEELSGLEGKYSQGVYPVITPRFIPSCSTECLEKLGDLAKNKKLHIQTHCSESDWEHNFAKEKYNMSDAKALNKFGFITDKTILAHAPFLEEEDVKLVASKGASIAHCPLSNAYFAGAVLPLKEFYSKGVNIGLATDISGGYCPNLYSAIRQAVISSRMLNDGVDPSLDKDMRGRKESSVSLNNAFYCATIGGGKALGLPLGKLEKGYSFDIQVLDISKGLPLYYPEKREEELLHKILLLSNENNISQVWVQGKRVK
ncbi:MAG: amidohydrolase family protein [Eubacteriales bacterium]|nr:amidohydrolase family protein [Eubacteriales bacterium]